MAAAADHGWLGFLQAAFGRQACSSWQAHPATHLSLAVCLLKEGQDAAAGAVVQLEPILQGFAVVLPIDVPAAEAGDGCTGANL
jgi:hypothetical protein